MLRSCFGWWQSFWGSWDLLLGGWMEPRHSWREWRSHAGEQLRGSCGLGGELMWAKCWQGGNRIMRLGGMSWDRTKEWS